MNFQQQRDDMVEFQIEARGVRDERVLAAFREVPREAFVPGEMEEFAYEDSPLPIGKEQTISQPYIVALMVEALELEPGANVLDVGTGSGYAAAVLSRIAAKVYSIERIESLAREAGERLERLGYDNVHVKVGDGSLGWPEQAPFEAIVVAAGGPEIPKALLDQLAPGGRLVIPVGKTPRLQELLRVRKTEKGEIEKEPLGGVRFVPLIGEEGWNEKGEASDRKKKTGESGAADVVRKGAEPFSGIEDADLSRLLERIGDSRLVLLGEASHGTAEFYEMRARITRELIEKKGFNFVAVEADWPDAAAVDRFVRGLPSTGSAERFFTRFPRWMWANESVLEFLRWLREYNGRFSDPEEAVGFHGLDMYSLYSSIGAVLDYLDRTDPETARIARQRYGCLSGREAGAGHRGPLPPRNGASEPLFPRFTGETVRRIHLVRRDPGR